MSEPFLQDHLSLVRQSPDVAGVDFLQRLKAEREIHELLVAYAAYYDAVDLDALADLFAVDAVLHNVRGSHVGRDQIRANFVVLTTVLARSLHIINNVTIRVMSDDTAAAATYLYSIAKRRSDDVMYGSGGTYYDDLRRIDGRWQISERRITAQLPHLLTAFAPSYELPHANPDHARGTMS